MKKPKQITAENLQNAWDGSCHQVKDVLELLYPDFFEKEETYTTGDKLELEAYSGSSIITSCGNGYEIILACSNGSCISGKIKVANIQKIKYDEIFKVINSHFEKIKS